uniref:Uncharacterized protein n=1 Tax=Arundo donax TaxID=35708 RepID=A0A0A9HNM7_ARUDO
MGDFMVGRILRSQRTISTVTNLTA